MDYSKTLNLPQTKFPMKADLPLKEPQILKFWEENNIYHLVQKKNQGKTKYILHDGPPYSNERIHLGQALNKILKDIVVKYKSMQGFDSPFTPGWDTHGLPNEIQAIKTYKIDRKNIDALELRKKCTETALYFVEIQKEQFKRLGVRANWNNPYLTLHPSYEATVIRTFKQLAKKDYIYRDLKPVYWCPQCETSLAEAEIEYNEKESPSIYVKFPLISNWQKAYPFLSEEDKKYIIIWTTTPWTLPANVAIAFHPQAEYIAIKIGEESYIVAKDCWKDTSKTLQLNNYTVIGSAQGRVLEGMLCKHPFLERESVVVLQNYVTLDQGTGCVHTAPGHGQEDYQAALEYNLPILVPVDERGFLTEEAGPFKGYFCEEANQHIIEFLRQKGYLLSCNTITHSYPHCWRCHKPVIFRATKQWFVAIDVNNLRERTLKAIESIKWYPNWGKDRIYHMVKERPDWCISRQRVWGIPLPVFYCRNCKEPIFNEKSISAVEELFATYGADSWFSKDAQEILPPDFRCPLCGERKGFDKEKDIFDVWFESAVSHLAILETHKDLSWPSNMYLEGSDQHRGWFQVSLLASIATKNRPPYNEVLTHGWVLDAEGKTMHKSLGNVIDPMDIVKEYGADILRLYFASVEFKNDIKIGEEGLKQISDVYRKIRNTCRFLLGNLYDYNPYKEKVPYPQLLEIDKWALHKLHLLIQKVSRAYENYDFHLVYHYLHNFCSLEMSSFYFDVLKDRLYTYPAKLLERKSAQTVLYDILVTLAKLMFPILSFTAEEVWQSIPYHVQEEFSIHLADWPVANDEYIDSQREKRWQKLLELRNLVYNALENARKEKRIKQSLEANVELYLADEEYNYYISQVDLLKTIFIVSQLKIFPLVRDDITSEKEETKVIIKIKPAKGTKCKRCWNYYEQLSGDQEHPEVCFRCIKVLKNEYLKP